MRLLDKYHQKYMPQTLVRVRLRPLSYYVSLLRDKKPFSFSRFGDGEWSAILSRPGENCDGHRFFPELGADLREALARGGNGYFIGMQIRAIKAMGMEIRDFLRKHNITIGWHDADVFHYANNAGTLFPLIQQLRTMNVVVVGPSHLRKLGDTVFPYDGFIEIPLKNCYLDKEDIYRRIAEQNEKTGSAVYAFSASMTTNVLIHRLFPAMGATSWLIDFGSLWDVYVGVKSRSGYEKEDWSDRIRKNLEGR